MNIFKQEMFSGMDKDKLTSWYVHNSNIPCLTTMIRFEMETPTDDHV